MMVFMSSRRLSLGNIVYIADLYPFRHAHRGDAHKSDGERERETENDNE